MAIKKVQLGGRSKNVSNIEDVSNEEKQIIFFADKDIPYLVEFHDYFKEDSFLYIVMGYYAVRKVSHFLKFVFFN